MRPFFYTAILLLLGLAPALAQEESVFTFAHFSPAAGLASNQVNTVVQDEEGYLWIGTTDGLQRYDGVRFRTFTHIPGDSFSLPSNPVLQLLMDKNKRLWLLLADGNVGIFDRKQFKFSPVKTGNQKKDILRSALKNISTDSDGNIYYLLAGIQLLQWNSQFNVFVNSSTIFNYPRHWQVTDFQQQPGTKKYWIGVKGVGIAVYNQATGNLSYAGHNTEGEAVVDAFDKEVFPSGLLFDKKGRAWFYCWNNVYPLIYNYNTSTGKYDKYELLSQLKSYHEIRGVFEQSDGTIWVHGAKVFAHFVEQAQKFRLVKNGYFKEHSISFESVVRLAEDREKNIWVSTDNNGLYRFNPSIEYFTSITHVNRINGKPGAGSPMSFMHTRWGTLLVGTWEDGLYHYDSNLKPVPTGIKGIEEKVGPFLWSMYASADSNTIWGAAQPGIYEINQRRREAIFYNPYCIRHRTIRQVAEDKLGNLWLGTHGSSGGVYTWNIQGMRNGKDTCPKKIEEIPHTTINKIIVDRNGLVWIGTSFNGAYAINPATKKVVLHFNKDSTGKSVYPLPEEGVSSFLDYSDSIVLISTLTRLIQYNRFTKTVRLVGKPGMMSGFIADLQKDKDGFVWISTSSSLYRLYLPNSVFIKFCREDGIGNDNFILASSAALPDGRLIFGASNQFIIFNPVGILKSMYKPQVHITGIDVMNRELPVDSVLQQKVLQLAHDDNTLNIYFSAITYTTPALIRYKLDGLDKDWKTPGDDKRAAYSYLPPGKYTLLFQLIDENGIRQTSEVKLHIHIVPPFWRTWWFYALLLLAIGTLLFWIDRERVKRREAVQQMRSNIAGNLHQEVSTALGNINVLSEMARLKADKEPQKSKEFIEQIHHRSGTMIDTMDDMLWAIAPENDSMEKTVERMEEYISQLQHEYGASIEMLIDEKVKGLQLDMQFRHEAYLLFKECVRGLVKACATCCSIHVAFEKMNLVFSVRFDNQCCDMQQLNNLLHSQAMEKRVTTIRARLHTDLHKSRSGLTIKVPLSGQAF
ncbi:MAG TPA: two-component regulator propeller domain-containing protein [Ferruginibacter sp.]|nr:two-component regulator propeller domain-containing protein [Ferruginibacter sp.]HMP19321.1 two-component regulator propeller domain-containing protein [Ferruginibacter sp.]